VTLHRCDNQSHAGRVDLDRLPRVRGPNYGDDSIAGGNCGVHDCGGGRVPGDDVEPFVLDRKRLRVPRQRVDLESPVQGLLARRPEGPFAPTISTRKACGAAGSSPLLTRPLMCFRSSLLSYLVIAPEMTQADLARAVLVRPQASPRSSTHLRHTG